MAFTKMQGIQLYHGDAIEEMRKIPDASIDFILTDPPYGITACKWDAVIPFEPMWEQIHRIIKPNGAIALFGSEPFSSALRMSNIKNYKYDWVWEKDNCSNFVQAKKRPLKYHELISIFYTFQCKYFPIMWKAGNKTNTPSKKSSKTIHSEVCANSKLNYREPSLTTRFPKQLIKFNGLKHNGKEKIFHPTQKPVPLLEYLIKTYTLEGETVLDFTMGSGSTGVASVNTKRRFIGIEKDEKYFEIAQKRIFDEYNVQPSII